MKSLLLAPCVRSFIRKIKLTFPLRHKGTFKMMSLILQILVNASQRFFNNTGDVFELFALIRKLFLLRKQNIES